MSMETKADQSPQEIGRWLGELVAEYPISKFMVSLHIGDPENYVMHWLREPRLELRGIPGEYALGGTENGLGIPPPIGSLSAGFDSESQRHTFRWHEKEGEYTKVAFSSHIGYGKVVSGPRVVSTGMPFHTLPAEPPGNGSYRSVYVVGLKEDVPSNASHIYANKSEQIEYFYRPFTNGIAPNWTAWEVAQSESVVLEEFDYPDIEKEARTVRSLSGVGWETYGRCVQRIRSTSGGAAGGMYRFFIAQTPGRVYRPALRYRIMDEGIDLDGQWSFEVMVGTLDPSLAYEYDYASRVLAGDYWQELNSKGSQIAVWKHDQSTVSTGDWILSQTGASDSDIPQKDILLGDDETAIFFCIRLQGYKPDGIVMDGVRLVDVTDGFPNAELREAFL
ncbi:MAG: hypothetical protein KF886_03240 [Candidatus Hydrogenedentes bacterium]|nr:hypothetical protein [Candidatus Hydrogenedentota bacterium]